ISTRHVQVLTARSEQVDPRDGDRRTHRTTDRICGLSCPSSTSQRGGHTVSVSIKPLEDRIVVKSSEAEQVTASGLVIPDTAKEKPQEGEVLAIGPGRIDDNGNRVPLDVAVGDKVIYSKYGGTEVKYDGDEYLILSLIHISEPTRLGMISYAVFC